MKRIRLSGIFILLIVLAMTAIQSCRDFEQTDDSAQNAHTYNSKVFHEWNTVFLEVERYARGYRPGPAPRALAYMGLSAYEAIVHAIPENNSLKNQFPGLTIPDRNATEEIYWPAAVNASYAYLMKRFFFHIENEYATLYNRINLKEIQLHNQYAEETTPEILERSENWGRNVAIAIYQWSQNDTYGHNAFLNPQPFEAPAPAPGKWHSQTGARGMFPYWGQVRTFALNETDKLARAPIPYSEDPGSLFYHQAEEVYKTVNLINQQPNSPAGYEYKWIAQFWSDDLLGLTFSPPPRLLAIADQIVEDEALDLAQAAELYAKLGMALHDNAVAIWHSKYHYNVERPDTYIRRVLADKYADAANWETILHNPLTGERNITPAFPAYPSGHSGFGAAGSKILSSFFEFNSEHPGTYTFTDQCHLGRTEFLGVPRTFASLTEVGQEDAYSRIPLGVHYRMDCDEGLRMGNIAAQRILELPWKK